VITSTRTHTRYWGEDRLERLRAEADALEADALGRMPYVDDDARDAMMRRISNLMNAIGFMGDRAT